jgi:hypothetical protein
MPIIPALRRLRQYWEFKASPGYIARLSQKNHTCTHTHTHTHTHTKFWVPVPVAPHLLTLYRVKRKANIDSYN